MTNVVCCCHCRHRHCRCCHHSDCCLRQLQMHDFRFLLQSRWELRSFRLLLWALKMEPIGCPQTSVRNYHYLLCNNPEECSSQLQMHLCTAFSTPKLTSFRDFMDGIFEMIMRKKGVLIYDFSDERSWDSSVIIIQGYSQHDQGSILSKDRDLCFHHHI